ncbi:MAG: response regulator [Magnetococcales bacterium]|nr:response regulator [Magnetococcales bacterium]
MATNHKASILIVEDDPVTSSLLLAYFKKENYHVIATSDGDGMWKALKQHSIDLILLDINLPGKDGFSLLKKLRIKSNISVVLVSSRNEDIDRILGLELGADDYVAKPFNEHELLVRVRNLLRRGQSAIAIQEEHQPTYRFAGWELNQVSRSLTSPKNESVYLTNGEFHLLLTLVEQSGKVLTRDQLMAAVSNREWMPTSRTIDVMVNRLRRKIEKDPKDPALLVTIHGVGYQFLPEQE